MEITLNQEKLGKALNYVSRAVSAKPNIPVLSNILLEVTRNDLRLSATNLEMGIHMWIGGQVEGEGKVTASGKYLSDFVSANGDGRIRLRLQGENLEVNSERAAATFTTISAQEFPQLPRVGETPFFTVKSSDLLTLLPKIIFACASDAGASRVQLTGVLIELSADQPEFITLVGLNNYRLSQGKLQITKSGEPEDLQLIVPAKSLQEMLKILSSEDAPEVNVFLSESKSQIIFQFAEVEFSIRLLEGPYPAYKQVIPTESAISLEVQRGELERAVKIVNTFARNSLGYRVEFDLDLETATLVLRSRVPDLGINETKVNLQNVTGSHDLKTAYNLQYLSEAVNYIKGDTIKLGTNSALQPLLFTSKDDKLFVHIVMPLERS